MKRIALVVVIAAGLMITSVAMAAGHLSGTYRTKIHSSAAGGQLNGKWTISFTHGHYTVSQKGHAVVHGRDSVRHHRISLTDTSGPAACPGTGVYTFTRRGRSLRFTKVQDSAACVGRATVLSGAFKKVR